MDFNPRPHTAHLKAPFLALIYLFTFILYLFSFQAQNMRLVIKITKYKKGVTVKFVMKVPESAGVTTKYFQPHLIVI